MLNIFKKNTIFGRNTNSDLPLYYDNITVEGKTTQETRSGKNLIDYSMINTPNLQDNGYYKIAFPAHKQILNGAFKENTQYTISFNGYRTAIQSGNAGGFDIYYTDNTKSSIRVDSTTSKFKSLTSIAGKTVSYIDATWGSTNETYIKDLQLEEGTIATAYEEYGAMPSPDYPSELVSVGYENLLNLVDGTYTHNGITGAVSNGIITLNGTATSTAFVYINVSPSLNIPLNETISLSANNPIANNNVRLRIDNDGYLDTILDSTNKTSTINVNRALLGNKFGVRVQSGATLSNFVIKPQIEKGTQAHSYIPYGKYGIEVKTNGKNLFDESQLLNATDWALNDDGYYYGIRSNLYSKYKNASGGFCFDYKFKENTQYTISFIAYSSVNSGNPRLEIYYTDGTSHFTPNYNTTTPTLITRTSFAGKTIASISYGYGSSSSAIDYLKNIQLIEGTQATSYEPYIGHTNLIILDNPLRSIGDTKDLLYIKNGMLYVERKIGSVVLDGSETGWELAGGTTSIFQNQPVFKNKYLVQNALSNFYKNVVDSRINANNGANSILKDGQFSFRMGATKDRIYFKKTDITSVNDFKSWLSTHNTEVQYVLATPTIEIYELDIQPMIFDSLGYGTLSDVVSDPLITEELNGSYILELEYMRNGKFSEYLVEENIIKAHGEPFSIYSVEKDTDEKIKILAKHWVINEWDKDFILDSAPTDLTAQNALAWIQQRSINHSDISVSGDCTVTSTARYVRKNMLSAIFKEDNAILTRFGGELSYNKNNVSVNKHRGSLSGLTIRQGKNLTGAKYYLDFSTVTTRLVPVGKDGLMLDEVYVDSPLINNYATPIIRKVEVNTTSKDELRSYCNKLYENGLDKPTVSIKIDFIELSKTDEYKQYSSLETAHLGDEVTAYIPSLNLNVSTRIVKTVYNDNLKGITALELGSVTPNIATSSVNVEMNLQKQVEQLTANDSLILDEAKEEASNLIKHPFGGYIYIDETTGNMYIMDTNNINTAQNVWRWGLGGLGFSSTGVNGTYGIAMTQDGKIVADYIKSGTLQSVTIKATNGTVGGYKIGENKLYAETYSSYNFDSSDLTAIRNYLMDEGSLSDDELIKYDIDGNGVVDSRDYVLIRNFIELGVTKNKSAKIIMQTGNNIFENAYILQDANANDILNINFNGFIYDHPNNGKFNLSGSKLTLTDINNNSMTISPNWLPKSVLSNWYSTSSTTLTDAKKHKLLVILGKPTSSSGIVSLIIPTDALSTSNQQFQCADESKYVAFNVRYNNDDVIITGAGRSSDGSILSAWTLL